METGVALRFRNARQGREEPFLEEVGTTMWIVLFSIAAMTAIALSVAAVMVQANQEETQRG